MRKALRDDPALHLLLQRVVADRFCRAHPFLDVTGFENRSLAVARIRGPHPGVSVGLKLDLNLYLIASDGI